MSSPSSELPPPAKRKIIELVGPRGYLDRPEDLSLRQASELIDTLKTAASI